MVVSRTYAHDLIWLIFYLVYLIFADDDSVVDWHLLVLNITTQLENVSFYSGTYSKNYDDDAGQGQVL